MAEGDDIGWYIYLIIVLLSILSAISNGMNIGLMGMDVKYMELMTKGPFETAKDEKEARLAKALLPLRQKGNQMLVTILFGCVITNTLISILMADIEGDLSGFLISTSIVVVFGEILPQALCTKYTLEIGYYTRFLLYFFYYALFVVSFPIAAILDKVLGEEDGTYLSKARMKKLFEQYENQSLLKPSERKMLSAALELKEKTVGKIMTPLSQAFMLDINQNLDENLKREIYLKGFSRIPIYDGKRENIIGKLKSRDLLLTNIDNSLFTIKQLETILIREVIAIDQGTKLEPLLKYFKQSKSEMAIVTKIKDSGIYVKGDPILQKIGIVTLEDIIEELLCEEIEDEREVDGLFGDRKRMKEKLVLLFNDHSASQILTRSEQKAICEFLSLDVTPFQPEKMSKEVLQALISISDVIDLESDSLPFSHNINDGKQGNRNQIMGAEDEDSNQNDQWKLFQTILLKESDNDKNEKKKIKQQIKTQSTNKIIDNYDAQTERPLQRSPTPPNQFGQGPQSSNESLNKDINANRILKNSQDDFTEMDVPDEENQSEFLYQTKLHKKKQNIIHTDVNPIICVRNVPMSDFYMILQGHVCVCSGQEGFLLSLGPFNYIGIEALLKDDYNPDFSAKVINQARLLKITKEDYMEAIEHPNRIINRSHHKQYMST